MAKTYAELQFESESWTRLIQAVKKKWSKIENRREFGTLISSVVYGDIMEHFEQQRGPQDSWKAWSDVYAKHMDKIGKGGNKILQDTGKLRMSFEPSKWKAQQEGILFYNKAKTKSGFPYAAAHDEGGPRLPQRKFMWFSSKGMVRMIKVVEAWLGDNKNG